MRAYDLATHRFMRRLVAPCVTLLASLSPLPPPTTRSGGSRRRHSTARVVARRARTHMAVVCAVRAEHVRAARRCPGMCHGRVAGKYAALCWLICLLALYGAVLLQQPTASRAQRHDHAWIRVRCYENVAGDELSCATAPSAALPPVAARAPCARARCALCTARYSTCCPHTSPSSRSYGSAGSLGSKFLDLAS